MLSLGLSSSQPWVTLVSFGWSVCLRLTWLDGYCLLLTLFPSVTLGVAYGQPTLRWLDGYCLLLSFVSFGWSGYMLVWVRCRLPQQGKAKPGSGQSRVTYYVCIRLPQAQLGSWLAVAYCLLLSQVSQVSQVSQGVGQEQVSLVREWDRYGYGLAMPSKGQLAYKAYSSQSFSLRLAMLSLELPCLVGYCLLTMPTMFVQISLGLYAN